MVRSTRRTAIIALASLGLASAYPVRRLVPQEHSHENILRVVNTFLKIDNPDNIVDAVFGLLGNAAASQGQGAFPDTDCLQSGIADRAFTNAKAAGDVEGMTNALIYRTLEKNTGKVGQQSVACTAVKAVNPEVGALSQHQDSASTNAAAINKAIVLELARQIASIGGDPLDAIKSGTFPVGDVNDPTAKGKSCNDENDAAGCINSLNLLVPDASEDEIAAAVADVNGGNGNGNDNAGNGEETDAVCPPQATVTVTVTASANAPTATKPAQTAAPPAATAPAAGAPVKTGNLSFGKCTDPTVKFGAGFENRKADEFTFLPNNLQEFNHNSAKNPDIIFQSNCDTLVNRCGLTNADDVVKLCRQAQADAKALGFTGAAADFFNGRLGFKTNFAALDKRALAPAAGLVATNPGGKLSFGKCTDPSVKFGAGFENRKADEFTFLPNNLQEFNHNSAKNPDIIFQSNCDTLVNRCGLTNADAVVKLCRQAQADAKALGFTGAAADFFNGRLGFKTNFAALDKGAAAPVSTAAPTAAPAASSSSSAAAPAATNAGGKLSFGKCTDPSVKFGAGFENRKADEFTFLPNNLQEFNHNSAKNPDIIFQSNCDTLVNRCGLTNADAVVKLCRQAQADAKSLGFTGAAADFFNGRLGFKTNFAALDA